MMHVIELTDAERHELRLKLAARNLEELNQSLFDRLSSTSPPPGVVVALRQIAEGSDVSSQIAREELERIGDRVSSDAQEGPS